MKKAPINSTPTVSWITMRFAAMAICMALAFPAHAQQAANGTTSAGDIKPLLDRIDQLELKLKQLEEKQAASASAAIPEPLPPVEMPTVNEVAPRLKLIVFGDVGAEGYNHNPDSFLFGSLDLFMRARLSDKISVLGEILFIAESDNTINVDVERLLLQYRQNDYFKVSFGRYHSSVGYYNTAFNYAQYLQTTTDRPFIYALDDAGGVLPLQDVGINVTGKIPSGKLGLNYVLEVSNGRAWGQDVEAAQNNQDANNSKSINGGLFMRPQRFSGLQLGFSILHDNLTVPGPAVHQTIATAHVVFINPSYEILNEGVYVRHEEPVSGSVFNTSAFYTQFSRKVRQFRPFLRYQYFNAPNNDPVYFYSGSSDYLPSGATSFVGRINGPSAGIRYDFTDYAALKIQYNRISLRGFDTQNGVVGQIAFSF